MTTAFISPSVLRWARERARLGPEELAAKADIALDRLHLWEQGEKRPTFKQARDLAKKLHVPFGFLFLPNPPDEHLPIPDLRTIGNHSAKDLSLDLHDLLTDILQKQDWFRGYLLEQEFDGPAFVGRFDLNTPATEIAEDLIGTLGVTLGDREEMRSGEAFFNLLMRKAEAAGVWVMRSGIVGNNTHRALQVEEFRGFAICDPLVPLVFINGQDAKAAQVFTFMHELAHLWTGQSGVSDVSLAHPTGHSYQSTEKLCNSVAAEVLVPQDPLRQRWVPSQSIERNVTRLATFFRVSTIVIARRALDLALVDWPAYKEYYGQQVQKWALQKKSGKGNPYRSLPVRNGKRFTEAVVRSALDRNLLLRDAGRLLGVNPSKITRLAQEMGLG